MTVMAAPAENAALLNRAAIKGRSLWDDSRRRLLSNKAAMAGFIVLSLLFAGTIQKLKIYTVSQMLTLRYGSKATQTSGIVMLAYTLMLCATSTRAYATIFVVLFGWDRWLGERSAFVGMHGFGTSAPGASAFEHFGITAEKLAEAARSVV